jgi:hypothetical protein
MEQVSDQIKTAIHQILGEIASDILMGRLDKTIDDCAGDADKLAEASVKIEKLVRLFVGVAEANVIGKRCKEILDRCNAASNAE